MNAYDFVHLAFAAWEDDIKGKTKLQKTIYFLGIRTGEIDNLGYSAHFYGPYSSEVAESVDRLRALGFVEQNVTGTGMADQRGFEVARYDFRLTEQGVTIALQKADALPEAWQGMQDAVGTLKAAGDPDYIRLSIAAKAYFMLGKSQGKATLRELSEMASRFGWSVTEDQVRKAVDFLQAIDLVVLADEPAPSEN